LDYSLATLPRNKAGNPQIGRFPYVELTEPDALEQVYTLPLSLLENAALAAKSQLCDSIYYLAAHAVVTRGDQTESAWADGAQIAAGGSWAMYDNFLVTCEVPAPPEVTACTTETAFLLGQTTFEQLFSANTRWGWQVGPIALGDSYENGLYAGAGRNDITKGTLVGSVKIEYLTKSAIRVTYKGTGKLLLGSHVYVGYTSTPTIAPGQFTCFQGTDGLKAGPCGRSFAEAVDTIVYDLPISSTLATGANIYVVAHASANVCE
jgi:hypothetical protein